MDTSGWGRKGVVGALVGALATGGCTGSPAPAEPGDEGTVGSSGSSGAAASSGGEPGEPMSLVRSEAWGLAPAADDPFADHRPEYVQCELGWGVETGVFEVDTELCLYGAFVQASLAPIEAGDQLELVLLHDALYANGEVATAHVAVALGSEIAWETELPIPSEADQVRVTWTATADVQIGSPVHLHLHNHGINNYRLVALTVAAR
jgi:hypothetical protein